MDQCMTFYEFRMRIPCIQLTAWQGDPKEQIQLGQTCLLRMSQGPCLMESKAAYVEITDSEPTCQGSQGSKRTSWSRLADAETASV